MPPGNKKSVVMHSSDQQKFSFPLCDIERFKFNLNTRRLSSIFLLTPFC